MASSFQLLHFGGDAISELILYLHLKVSRSAATQHHSVEVLMRSHVLEEPGIGCRILANELKLGEKHFMSLLYSTSEQIVFVRIVLVKRGPMHHRTVTDLLHANGFKTPAWPSRP